MENSTVKIYSALLSDIKARLRQAQIKAIFSANAEMLAMYWDVGKMIHQRQQEQGWGAKIIPQLSNGLKNEISEIKGFSVRNIQFMVQFYNQYPNLEILQPVAAKLDESAITKLPVSQLEIGHLPVVQIGWTHNVILMQKIKDMKVRQWYMYQIIENGWSKDVLAFQIDSKLYERSGKAISNFKNTLPEPLSDLAQQTLKDPYIFDFMTLAEGYKERDIEKQLVKHVTKFLLELGKGFAFVGQQYHVEIAENDYYIDLLFYHIRLKCYVVIELKNTKFIPEYAGKLNFYLSAVDSLVKQPDDNPTIGILLCRYKNNIEAEFALRDINKPMGISEFKITEILPENLKSSLPTIEEIENEFKDFEE
jgi:predicted nuclease of restriction endonuclease-like (RecB) superfamily